MNALFTSLILAGPSRVIRRVSRDFGTVSSTSQLANESRGIPARTGPESRKARLCR